MIQIKIQVSIVESFNLIVNTLGPGTYAAEKIKMVTTVKDMMSNSFTTKVGNDLAFL